MSSAWPPFPIPPAIRTVPSPSRVAVAAVLAAVMFPLVGENVAVEGSNNSALLSPPAPAINTLPFRRLTGPGGKTVTQISGRSGCRIIFVAVEVRRAFLAAGRQMTALGSPDADLRELALAFGGLFVALGGLKSCAQVTTFAAVTMRACHVGWRLLEDFFISRCRYVFLFFGQFDGPYLWITCSQLRLNWGKNLNESNPV